MKITTELFDAKLVEILDGMTGSQLLSIPGVYEAVSEELNNEVIEAIGAAEKSTWDLLTEDEKSWIEEAGYTGVDVDENPAESTASRLRLEYACRGHILHDAEEMERRLGVRK